MGPRLNARHGWLQSDEFEVFVVGVWLDIRLTTMCIDYIEPM